LRRGLVNGVRGDGEEVLRAVLQAAAADGVLPVNLSGGLKSRGHPHIFPNM